VTRGLVLGLSAALGIVAVLRLGDVPRLEVAGVRVADRRDLETRGSLTVKSSTVEGGAQWTLCASHFVALGNGFEVLSGGSLVIERCPSVWKRVWTP
jgi:hypothetical protein